MERCVCSFFPLIIELRVGMMLLLSSHSFLNIGWLVTGLLDCPAVRFLFLRTEKHTLSHGYSPCFRSVILSFVSRSQKRDVHVILHVLCLFCWWLRTIQLLSQKLQNKKMFYSLYYSVTSMSHTQGFFCKIIRSVLHYFHLRPSLTTNSNRSYNTNLCGYLM